MLKFWEHILTAHWQYLMAKELKFTRREGKCLCFFLNITLCNNHMLIHSNTMLLFSLLGESMMIMDFAEN